MELQSGYVWSMIAQIIIKTKKMALNKLKRKNKGVHSKNASKGQNAYKQPYRGQGKKN